MTVRRTHVAVVLASLLLVGCSADPLPGNGLLPQPPSTSGTSVAPPAVDPTATSAATPAPASTLDPGSASRELSAYFAAVAAAGLAYSEAGERIDQALSGATDAVQVAKAEFPVFFEQLETFVGALAEIEAPEEVADVHAAAVERGQAVVEAFIAVVAEVERIEDPAGLEELFAGPTWSAAMDASHQLLNSCLVLQSMATRLEIDADLHCF